MLSIWTRLKICHLVKSFYIFLCGERLRQFPYYSRNIFWAIHLSLLVNPLPDMSILGSSNSTANKDMMAKIHVWTNGGQNYLLEKKTLWEKEKFLVTSNFSFSHNIFKTNLLLMC